MMKPRAVKVGGLWMADVRHFWPDDRPALELEDVVELVVHHDGVLMLPGDHDYSGTTMNEDLGRIRAIHEHSERQGWGAFPYHKAASPNGRLFLCRDLRRRGSHIYERNHETGSVVLLGNFERRVPGDAQLCAAAGGVVATFRELGRLVGVPAHRTAAVPGHATACPGETWSRWQGRLYDLVRVRAGLTAAGRGVV